MPITKKKKKAPKTPTNSRRPLGVVLYGPPKVGKTSFASSFPEVGLIDIGEDGLEDLQDAGICTDARILATPATWEDLNEAIDNVYGIKTLVLDGLSGVQRLCFEYCCREEYNDNWFEFMSYSKGPRTTGLAHIGGFIRKLRGIRRSGISVICIAHAKEAGREDPLAGNYGRITANLDKALWDAFEQWAQLILFMRKEPILDKTGRQAKVKDYTRLIYFDGSPAFDAGNRLGLEGTCDMGFSCQEAYKNFTKALEKNATERKGRK
jgi:hypothetical protein